MPSITCKECGRPFDVYPCHVRSGRKKFCSLACGNKGKKYHKTHGMHGTRLYQTWQDMKARCAATSHASAYYHDRGIRVCQEWADSFVTFRDWALLHGYTEELEIDRIDNDKGYEPGNCRWATRKQQMANTRKRRDAVTSRFKGVSWCANAGEWRVQLHQNGKPIHGGLFADEESAAREYDRRAKELFGEFASLNFKTQGGAPS